MDKMKKVKVLIVDDSAFMRNALTTLIATDPELQVIGTAKNGVEAIDKVFTLKPDIVTMDVEMPKMDGLEALRVIMDKSPLPVIMVSSMTTEGAQVTLDALDIGAVDFIPKNLSDLSLNIVKIKDVLTMKLKQIGRRGIKPKRQPANQVVTVKNHTYTAERKISVIAIGSSTGGPKILQDILVGIPADFRTPIVIAQHMPASFTGPFADRLNSLSAVTIKEAKAGEVVKSGVVYIAPGCGHMKVVRRGALETIIEIEGNRDDVIYRPSVDILFRSVAESYPGRALGVILTGMGKDGLEGAREIKKGGGRIFAQDEETSVVFGMPGAIVEEGIADKILPAEKMSGEIVNVV